VFTTVGNDQNAEFCGALGADVVINYRKQNFVTEVQAHTAMRGVDVILDGRRQVHRAKRHSAHAGRPAGADRVFGGSQHVGKIPLRVRLIEAQFHSSPQPPVSGSIKGASGAIDIAGSPGCYVAAARHALLTPSS